MLIFAIITKLFILPDRLHLLEHCPEILRCHGVDLCQLICRLAGGELHGQWLAALITILRLLSEHKVELLLDNLLQLARPEEVLQHGRGEFAEKHAHEAKEALAHGCHLIFHDGVIELELLIRGEEADL